MQNNSTVHNQTQIIAETGRQELVMIREFDAPRELVYRAFTEPDLMIQWLSTGNGTLQVDLYENRNGGRWRFILHSERGTVTLHGVMHEVLPYERLIRTFEMEGLPSGGHVSLEIALFESITADRTKLTLHSIFRSVADRDGMIKAGVEQGAKEHHRRLDELFKKISK
jgi:uncharacterized protein YndB with AHSA1/START domain